jgi:hypothetical protein
MSPAESLNLKLASGRDFFVTSEEHEVILYNFFRVGVQMYKREKPHLTPAQIPYERNSAPYNECREAVARGYEFAKSHDRE